MQREYFIYNDQQYNKGTIVVLQKFSVYSRSICKLNATFLYYDTDTNEYVFKLYGAEHRYSEEDFNKNFCEIYDSGKKYQKTTNTIHEKHTFADELRIDGLFIAWAWYVFVMCVGVIFYDRIWIWILASVIFFNYRNNKLKEAGYK